MITEEEKYKAEALRIIGIGMLMPAGAIFLTPMLLIKQLGLIGFIIYLVFSFIGISIGVMLLEAGRKILDKNRKERKRWNHSDQMGNY